MPRQSVKGNIVQQQQQKQQPQQQQQEQEQQEQQQNHHPQFKHFMNILQIMLITNKLPKNKPLKFTF